MAEITVTNTDSVYDLLSETLSLESQITLKRETLAAEALDDPTLTNAAEWNDTDANVTHNAGAGTVTWDGLGIGDIFTVDGAGQFTVGKLYKIVVVIDSISAGSLRVANASYAFRGTNIDWTTAGTKTTRVSCTHDLGFSLFGTSACDGVVSNISIKEVTNVSDSYHALSSTKPSLFSFITLIPDDNVLDLLSETLGLESQIILNGETLGAEALDDPTLTNAAEWNDTDANVTHNAGAGTVTWDGLGTGMFYTVDGAGQFTVGKLYKIVIVIDSITVGNCNISAGGYAFRGTPVIYWSTAGAKTIYKTCTNDLGFGLFGGSTCDAVVSNISVKEVTANADSYYALLSEAAQPISAIKMLSRDSVMDAVVAQADVIIDYQLLGDGSVFGLYSWEKAIIAPAYLIALNIFSAKDMIVIFESR